VTGANVLVAIFAERESNAAYFLQEQDMTRYDAVNFIAHGVAKDPSLAKRARPGRRPNSMKRPRPRPARPRNPRCRNIAST
jgi:ATP-dependent Clp protease ATP-binding subunit ClpA